MPTARQYIQIVTTTARREEADRIARMLVEERLAACAQVSGPITSTYHWQGKIETSEEWQCRAKSRLDLWERLDAAMKRHEVQFFWVRGHNGHAENERVDELARGGIVAK